MRAGLKYLTNTLTMSASGIARVIVLLSLAIAIPSLGLPQYVTGPAVNAVLIIAVDTLGLGTAIALSSTSSFAAWGSGILPGPLVVMIPFIFAGNALFVTSFRALRRVNYWLAVLVAAVLKCAWLWTTVEIVVSHPFIPVYLETSCTDKVCGVLLVVTHDRRTLSSGLVWPESLFTDPDLLKRLHSRSDTGPLIILALPIVSLLLQGYLP